MNLPFLKKTSKPLNKFLTLDIGSEAVNCMAFYADPQQKVAKIIGLGDAFLDPGSVRAGHIVDFEKVEEAARDAILKATEDFEDHVTDVIFGVSGDLALGLITTAKSARGKAGPIQPKELEAIELKIIENAFIQARNEIMEFTGNSDLEIEPVTISTVYTKVNNHIVKDPYVTEGETIELAVFTAFTPSYHVKNIQKLAKKLHLNILAVGSTMFSLVNSLKYSEPELKDYIVMDVGSDCTDIGVIFGNGIVATRNLHIAGHHFTEEISQKMGIGFKDAERLKHNYTYEKLSTGETTLVQNSVRETLEIWLDGVELLFGEFSGVKTFASKILLVGGGARLPDIYDYISGEPWTRSIPFKSPPEFRKLNLNELKKVADSTGKAGALEYVLPASLSIIYLEMLGLLND